MQMMQMGGGSYLDLLKAVIWQTYVWQFLRRRFKAEIAIFLFPPALLGIFGLGAFAMGVGNQQLMLTSEGLLAFYGLTTLGFWLVTFLILSVHWLLLHTVRSARRLVRWISRG